MSTSINVNFEGDDEDYNNYNENDTGDTSFDPASFDSDVASPLDINDVTAPIGDPSAQPFDPATSTPVDPERLVRDEIRRQSAANKRNRTRAVRDATEQAKERHRREQLQQKRDYEDAVRRAKESAATVRQSMSAYRTQAYSASYALGLPGYVGASLIDQYFIRPQEEANVTSVQNYLTGMREDKERAEEERRQAKRDELERIRNMPIQAVDVDAIRAAHGLPVTETGGNDGGGTGGSGGTGGTGGNNGVGSGGGSGNGGGGTGTGAAAPPPGGNNIPPRIPPTVPSSTAFAALGSAAAVVTGVMVVGQAVNSAIESLGKTADDLIKADFGKDPLTGVKANVHAARDVIDPFHINPVAQVAVTGFDLLISLTEQIRDYAKTDIEFSPQALGATVQGDIAKLLQQIRNAERLDPLKAEVIRASNQLDMAWNQFRSEMFAQFAPTVINLLRILTAAVKMGDDLATLAGMAQWTMPQLKILVDAAGMYLRNDKKELLDEAEFFKSLDNFLDPDQLNVPGFPIPNPPPA